MIWSKVKNKALIKMLMLRYIDSKNCREIYNLKTWYVIKLISGGLGLGVLEGCLVTEEYGFGCSGIMAALMITDVGVRI